MPFTRRPHSRFSQNSSSPGSASPSSSSAESSHDSEVPISIAVWRWGFLLLIAHIVLLYISFSRHSTAMGEWYLSLASPEGQAQIRQAGMSTAMVGTLCSTVLVTILMVGLALFAVVWWIARRGHRWARLVLVWWSMMVLFTAINVTMAALGSDAAPPSPLLPGFFGSEQLLLDFLILASFVAAGVVSFYSLLWSLTIDRQHLRRPQSGTDRNTPPGSLPSNP